MIPGVPTSSGRKASEFGSACKMMAAPSRYSLMVPARFLGRHRSLPSSQKRRSHETTERAGVYPLPDNLPLPAASEGRRIVSDPRVALDEYLAMRREVTELREALKWALCHVEMKEDEIDFHEQYERAYAAYKSSVPSQRDSGNG